MMFPFLKAVRDNALHNVENDFQKRFKR